MKFKKKKMSEEMGLQITSMADIFMILLVFLLKNYATSVSTITPTTGVKLPVSASGQEVKETLRLEISAEAILVDQKPIVRLKAFEPSADVLPDSGGNGPLYRALSEQQKKQPASNLDSNLIVMADERTPYSTIKKVLASAAQAGFVDIQLIVAEER